MLFETDVILAAIKLNDPLREYAVRVLDQEDLVLSPFSLLELHLLTGARRLEVRDFPNFMRDFSTLLATRTIRTLPDRAQYHAQAFAFESRFGLSFFTSLHAGVAKVEAEIIASFDESYDRLRKEGVKRLDPKEL